MKKLNGSLKGKVLFITGGSRGIGLAIALAAARDGAKIVVAARTVTEHEKLPGTIYTAADEIRAAGGEALAVQMDVRDEEQVKAAIAEAVRVFGGIDIVVNNAGAIYLSDTGATDMKRFDLMMALNMRAVYMVTRHALPHLCRSENPHILNMSPPLNLDAGWFAPQVAYTMSKYGMSLCTLGMSREFKDYGIAVNSLWPETAIDTSAVRNKLGGDKTVPFSRKPEIVADAAYWLFNQDSQEVSGNFFTDVEILSKTGMTDFSAYNCVAGHKLMADFFLGAAPDRMPVPVESSKATLMAIVEEARKAREKAAEAVVTEVDAGAAVETASVVVAAETAAVVAAEAESVSEPAANPYKSFVVSRTGDVAYLSFNNPARLNCLGVNFFEELPRAITAMEESGVRALVIEAAVGRHFSSGLDLNVLANESLLKVDTEGDKIRLNGLILSWQKALSSVAYARFPVIAAVDGLCLGAALDLVSACDFCLATKDAQFSIEEINVGLMADLGSLQRLPRRIPESVVRYLAFTGEKMSAHAAQAAGLVLTVYDNSDALGLAAQVMAKKIAAKEASAITASKMALNFNHGHTLEESLAECARLQTIWINPERVMAEVRRIATKQ